jgi:branched-chain amino acid transport system substrate-binding protein
VFGPATVAAAAVADCERTPLLAPTATEDRLVHIGPYIFQLNTTPRMQGMNTANYAINRLGLYRLAILASTDPFGKDMASGFLQEADQQGGYVHIQEFFFPETKDFTAQLDHIQEVARKLRRRQSEAGAVDVPENAPLDTIDGILVAADPDAIPLIASQLATRKVQTRLLGGDGWHSEGVVRDGGDYVEGAIFAAGYDENTEPCAQFIKAFAERYGRHPTKVAAFGYDAMMLINRVYAESGSRTRVSIRDHLAEVADYVGASGAISFEKGHANCKSHILQIREGHFVPAEESE